MINLIITKKNKGIELTKEEINYFVENYTNGLINDDDMTKLLQAICKNGMNEEETILLTTAMINSGETLDLACFGDLSVDKHSTGGVGDKTSLIVSSLAASCGCKIAKMSGHGLGFTGGTIDKLDAIPGFNTNLTTSAFINQVKNINVAIANQIGNLVPADKKIYALRNLTNTIDSIPLIASSIMSKKIAAGAKNIVLDIKVGSGAFMKNLDRAKELANLMIKIGKAHARNVTVVISNMDIPLGNKVGNILEVQEVVALLNNEINNELTELCLVLASEMVSLGLNISIDKARAQVEEKLKSGQALSKFRDLVIAQGGNYDAILNSISLESIPVISIQEGYISTMDTALIGQLSQDMGAGRTHKDDQINYEVGINIIKKTGEYVTKGELIAYLYMTDISKKEEYQKHYLNTLTFDTHKPSLKPIILEIINDKEC